VAFDVYGGASSLTVPVHVSEGDCDLGPNCRTVNGIQWCYNPNACGEACDTMCNALGLSLTISDADWFAAQDTQDECQAINDAFGLGGTVILSSFTFACIEDIGGAEAVPGAPLGPLLCSTFEGCPSFHRTDMDQAGLSCDSGFARRSLCPCN
jgi:hypothetical protein